MNDDENPNPEQMPATPEQLAFTALERVGLHAHTKAALEQMAYEGLPLPLAAKNNGIRPDNLERAFNKPHVRRAFNQVVKAIRDNAAQAAYMRINHMSVASKSEQVRLKANEWVAGVDGISKVQKVEGQMRHSHSFKGFAYPDLDPVDVTPADIQSDADDADSQ